MIVWKYQYYLFPHSALKSWLIRDLHYKGLHRLHTLAKFCLKRESFQKKKIQLAFYPCPYILVTDGVYIVSRRPLVTSEKHL